MFSGIGSASLGLRTAGFEVVAALDNDAKACEIYERNFRVKPIVEDIRRVSGKRILATAGLKRGEVDLLVGCPPCQGFSSLGKTTHLKGSRDYRNSLVRIFSDRLAEIRPRFVVFENVPGMLHGSYRHYFSGLLARLKRLGYAFVMSETRLVEAADYGVPQFRKRVVVLATEKENASGLCMPERTHFPLKEIGEGKTRQLTVRDAIGDLPSLEAGETHANIPLHSAVQHSEKAMEIIRNIPKNGGSRTDLPKHLWLPCHKRLVGDGAESVYGRMRWNSPSPTITTRADTPSCGRFIHPEQDRGITLREAARLQTIPDDFELYGLKKYLNVWIGNAMPTLLGETLGNHVAQFLT